MISLFFLRVLYNATYLNANTSELLVELMTKSKYETGIRAGVPNEVTVAHKFGLLSEKDGDQGQVRSRQLHDCGIVYHVDKPYVLCVMTKSNGSILGIEEYLSQVSAKVYQSVDRVGN